MEVKKELSDREFVEDAIDRRNHAHQAIQPVEVDELILAVRTLRLDLAEAREDTARLELSREAIDGALDRLAVDGDCFDFEGLTNHLRQALAAIDAAREEILRKAEEKA